MQRSTLVALVLAAAAATACTQVLGLNGFKDGPREAGAATGGSGGSGASAGTAGAGASGGSGGMAGGSGGTTPGDASDGSASGGAAGGPGGAAGDASTDGSTCTCLPTAPTTWAGPLALFDGSSAPPACPAGWTTFVDKAGSSVTASPASCAACSCSVSSPAMCLVSVVTGTSCTSSCSDITSVGSACATLNVSQCGSATYLKSASVTGNPSAGTCTADSVTNPTPTKATFADQARACFYTGASAQSCGSGEKCVPAPPSGYPQRYCIATQDPSANCSASAVYTHKYVVATSIKDTRGCSACSCSSTTGGTCSGANVNLSFALAKFCAEPAGGTTFAGSTNTCMPFKNTIGSNVAAGYAKAFADAVGATCAAPTGGTPIGSAVLDPATTWVFCCTK